MSRIITDAELDRMHEDQAHELRQVPEQARYAVLDRAHFLQNTSGGRLSGALYRARRELTSLGGDADALLARTRNENSRLMARSAR